MLHVQIVMQGIVDDLYRFLAYELGWPGSMADVTVWYASHIWRHCVDHFTGKEYVLGDKGNCYLGPDLF